MKRILWMLVLAGTCAFSASAQTTTTYVGTLKDLTGATITSGRVTFQLNSPTGGVIPGTGSFTSTIVSCLINSSGTPVSSSDGVSPCTIVNNSSLTPMGTSYTVCRQAYNVTPGSCFITYANGGTVDMSTLIPTPATGPTNGLQQGPAGPQGPAGAGFISGLASDGSNGIAVTGKVTGTMQDKGGQVFSVMAYGATGNGSTNDCSAITAAETARETAGGGTLYFPQGNYNVGSSCRITLAANGTVQGTGSCGQVGNTYTYCSSVISSSDTTGNLFTVTANTFIFADIGLFNSATPSAGAGILTNGSNYAQKVDYRHISVIGFYDDIDALIGGQWAMVDAYIGAPIRYGMEIENTINQDAGDWSITASFFNAQGTASNASGVGAIHILGAGGGKIIGNKIIGNPSATVSQDGIYANSTATSQLLIASNSIEQWTGSCLNVPNWTVLTYQGFYCETAPSATVSPILLGDVSGTVGGGSITDVSLAAPDITFGSGSSGEILPYAHNSANTHANVYPSTVSAYFYDQSADLMSPTGTFNVGDANHAPSTDTINLNSNGGNGNITSSFGSGGISFTTPRCGVNFGGYQWNNSGGTQVMAFNCSTKVLSGLTGVTLGAGGNSVLRCTTAGALPIGALTTNAASCGASTATGLVTP